MKDAKGHGSDSRGGSTFDRLNSQRVAQGFKPMPEKNRGMHDFFDYMAGEGPKPDFMNAANATAGNGPKSVSVPVHPALASDPVHQYSPLTGERVRERPPSNFYDSKGQPLYKKGSIL